MDGSRFDAWSRALADARSRRGLARLLTGLALGGPIALRRTTDTAAKKKGKGRKKRPARCQPRCAGKACGPDGCGGVCGACPAVGQVCTAEGLCVCTATSAGPDVCGGVCRERCDVRSLRKPDCGCCVANGQAEEDSNKCCSTSQNAFTLRCVGRPPGLWCDFDAQCASDNCVAGKCSACGKTQDYCKNSADTCGAGGFCVKTAGGQTRCGVQPQGEPTKFFCGDCTTDAECQQRHGSDGKTYFCSLDTGPNCGCDEVNLPPRACVVSMEPKWP